MKAQCLWPGVCLWGFFIVRAIFWYVNVFSCLHGVSKLVYLHLVLLSPVCVVSPGQRVDVLVSPDRQSRVKLSGRQQQQHSLCVCVCLCVITPRLCNVTAQGSTG